MSLSNEDLIQIAKLAQISVSPEELETLRGELNGILAFVETLSSVPTRGVEPTSHVHGVVNAFREDVVKKSLPLSDLEQNAPDFSNEGFTVPKITLS